MRTNPSMRRFSKLRSKLSQRSTIERRAYHRTTLQIHFSALVTRIVSKTKWSQPVAAVKPRRGRHVS
eukprot:5715377-Amphidinium_carterae.1